MQAERIPSHPPLDSPAGGDPAYTRALERLHAHGPSLRDGLFSHAPMVAEALVELGASDRIAGWLDSQSDGFTPRPRAVAPIVADDWRSALGQRDRFDDWSRYFEWSFEADGWPSTLETWIGRLAPGFVTAACHGVIRTGHAVRALGRHDGPVERRELADALASWASMYLPLPFAAQAPRGTLSPRAALVRLTPVPAEHRPAQGLIVAGYFALVHAPAFSEEVAAVDLSGGLQARVDELVGVFADLFVRRAHTPFLAIVFAHAVTSAAAVGHISKVVGDDAAGALLFRAWEAGCALEASFGSDSPGPHECVVPSGPEALRLAAIADGDDHVVKLTEACLSTFARSPDPVLLDAAAVVQQRL